MKVSIITITFNSENTLEETFNSVLAQNYRPLEYIVIDGNSKDSTLDIVKKYEELFENAGIQFLWKSETDKGISDAFNKGIEIATGDLIGIINSDDKLTPKSLEILAEYWESGIDVYYGDCVIFNNYTTDEYLVIPKFIKDENTLRTGMPFYHPSTFISKNAYNKFGTYDLKLHFCMDRDLLLRFYEKKAKFKYINKPLAYYREGGANQVNHKKTAAESEKISVCYGLSPQKAKAIKFFSRLKDYAWMIIKKTGMERFFHRKL